jgi:hypothetical protein
MSLPMEPLAPPRFSTTKVCFIESVRRAATARASRSVVPPGGYGTTIFTGRSGYFSCAPTAGDKAWMAIASSEPNSRGVFFMSLSVEIV